MPLNYNWSADVEGLHVTVVDGRGGSDNTLLTWEQLAQVLKEGMVKAESIAAELDLS
jgi:hypothetical protein